MIEADSNRRFVILQGGLVVNVAMSAAPLGPEWVESKEGEIGDLSDGKTFVKPDPHPLAHPAASRGSHPVTCWTTSAKAHGYDSMLSLCSYADSTFRDVGRRRNLWPASSATRAGRLRRTDSGRRARGQARAAHRRRSHRRDARRWSGPQ
jgi:hypothetical protein